MPPPVITPTYAAASMTRDYVANCPMGTHVAWRTFEWQATVPTGTSIQFFAQTKATSAASYQPTSPVLVATATPASGMGPGTWYRAGTVDQALASSTPPLASLDYLRITITLNPTAPPLSSTAPTLHQWRQIYDCLPAE